MKDPQKNSNMPNKTLPLEFKKSFFLQFTKELIMNSMTPEIFDEIVKEDTKEKIKEVVQRPKEELITVKRRAIPVSFRRKILPPTLQIPEERLPFQFQYLKPTPKEAEIDLGRLNPLIQDPLIKEIECNGSDENIIVHLTAGRMPVELMLTKDEIKDIMKKFSEATKIPMHQGVYKVVFGKLILSAIISDVIDSKFIIKKMKYTSY